MVRAELTFEEYPGETFTVKLSPVSMRAYFAFVEHWAKPGIQPFEQIRDQVEEFIALAEPTWTTGEPTFLDLDWMLIQAIVGQWMTRIREVPLPLLVGSSVTAVSPERSTETAENGSSPHPSSPEPRRSTRSSGHTRATPSRR